MYVRWIGAFGKGESFSESMKFELNRPITDEIACERLESSKKNKIMNPKIQHCGVGFIINKKHVFKNFNGDCWSLRDEEGRLYKTRNPKVAKSNHLESWAYPVYSKIVVVENKITSKILKEVKYFARKFNLEIVYLVLN